MIAILPLLRIALAGVLLCLIVACSRYAPRKIVLIGGAKSEGSGRHDYANGVRVPKALMESSRSDIAVVAYPDGWPDDPAAFAGAATLVWYFDGLDKHPLLNADRRAQFESLMRQHVGLVALHQASTVPMDDDLGVLNALGAARYGTFDRTTESAELISASPLHPIVRGVSTFGYRDEFYPTLRFAGGTPVLRSTLHVQYRDGRSIVDDIPEETTVAWAFERDGGGRSFGFSGAHYLVAFDQPMIRKMLLNAIYWTAGLDVPADGVESRAPARLAETMIGEAPMVKRAAFSNVTTFHHDAERTGWYATETSLTPAAVSGASFGLLWESPPLDEIDGAPPRLYASPLYVDRVEISSGQHAGETFPVVFAASSNGFVYAINAAQTGDVASGRILWRTQLAPPCHLQPAPLDGVPTGVLATPIIDVTRKRIYVTHCDPAQRWQAYALDITSGTVLPGWPVRLDEATFNRVNRNAGPAPVAPTRRFDFRVQRGALNLSPDGSRLYATFGETETGWIAAIDTENAKVASAFASVAMPHRGSGGIWGVGGAAVDGSGDVFISTGSGFNGFADQPNDWTQSVLQLSDAAGTGFALRGTYTPFNYCRTAAMDIDLGSGGPMLLPDLDPATTATPKLLAVGGKQGNVYLLDREHMPGRFDRRPACGTRISSDASLHAPGSGPLNVFAPYSDKDGALDQARSRSEPAYFRDESGVSYLFVTGNTRKAEGSSIGIPPSLVRVKVVAEDNKPAHLRIDRREQTVVFGNPGSPVVTSNGARDAIVWVLDENARRSALLVGDDAPQPILYAFDATTLALLWKSAPGTLFTSGKYNEPAFARGNAIVGTDRIQAFGVGRVLPARASEPRKTNVAAAQPSSASPSNPADGQAIYASRCALCHDHPQGNIPPRELIATRSHDEIVDALSTGAMRAQAAGLRRDEIESVARYLKR